jgi:hypothetical protein
MISVKTTALLKKFAPPTSSRLVRRNGWFHSHRRPSRISPARPPDLSARTSWNGFLTSRSVAKETRYETAFAKNGSERAKP